MKKILIFAATLVATLCLAGADSVRIPALSGSSAAVVTKTSTHTFSGHLESIYIDVTAPATQTVVVATATDTLLTATAVTADTTISPTLRYQ